MSPRLARLKLGVQDAVEVCGGIDGAAASAERKRSVAGDWNNGSHRAFPPLDCALAMDRVAISQDRVPPILARYAAELGHACFRLPDPGAGDDALTCALIAASAEFGDVAHEVRDATRDGEVNPREERRIVTAIDEAIAALVKMRVGVVGEEGK